MGSRFVGPLLGLIFIGARIEGQERHEAGRAGGAATAAKSRAIGLVDTWRELLRQPEIRVGDRCVARLGIEALKAPRHSGVLLYCLAK